MEVKELLPIGSVVLLKKGKKRLMVFGVKQTDNRTGTEYYYIGVLYPEGNMGEAGQYLFNHENIEQIFFRGYEDGEREAFMEKLSGFYDGQGSEDILQGRGDTEA